MKIIGTSTFHNDVSPVVFNGITEGLNIRKLRGPRSNYCLDYSNSNSHVCGCGFPVARTRWELHNEEDLEVARVEECGAAGEEYGKGYLKIFVYPVSE